MDFLDHVTMKKPFLLKNDIGVWLLMALKIVEPVIIMLIMITNAGNVTKNIPCRVTSNVTKGDTPPTQDLKKLLTHPGMKDWVIRSPLLKKIFGNSSKILPHHCSKNMVIS